MANTESSNTPGESITLAGERLEQARKALSDINLGVVAAYRLAIDAADNHGAEWYLVAIQNIAKVSARKADLLMELLGDPPGGSFGNFADEFAVVAADPAQ